MRKSSPWLRFGIFLSTALLVFGGLWLSKIAETPPWRQQDKVPTNRPVQVSGPVSPSTEGDLPAFGFVTYNVKNWLVSTQSPEKSVDAKNAVVTMISECKPDVVGLCEIGNETDVFEIRDMLKEAGTDLPHTHYTGGVDSVRHLAILSRFPIISIQSPETAIPGEGYSMQRGILDVTIRIGGQPVRFVGLHLKSKRVVPQFDQAQLRIAEAEHVRNHINEILTSDPSTLLVAYGDLNDHPRSLSTRALLGTYRSPLYLSPVHVKDSRGERWTHFYSAEDSYSRIDFVAVSKALKPHIDRKLSRIIDAPEWSIASDHRPVFVGFK